MNFYIVYADAEPGYIGLDHILGIYKDYEMAQAEIDRYRESVMPGSYSYRMEFTEIRNFELG